MAVLTEEEQEKIKLVLNDLDTVYWTEIFALAFPQVEKFQVKDRLRKSRDKLNEVLGEKTSKANDVEVKK
jgi:hypothetical protein